MLKGCSYTGNNPLTGVSKMSEKIAPHQRKDCAATPLLTIHEVAGIFKCCRRSVEKMAAFGQIPRGFLIGKRRLWRASDIDNFIAAKALDIDQSRH
jgi:predicted DNA-binding transcriptional regulator AlpA